MAIKDIVIRVSVCISAYNHEEFIEEALHSVLEQECNFDYEVILSNDHSTDCTHEVITRIIENHPHGDKIRYYNQAKNLGINGNLIYTLEQAAGKYIALLEGDDYWTDQNKLQKQFDFLESSPDYTICTGGYESITPARGLVVRKLHENVDGITYEFNKKDGFRAHYLNMFFRSKSLDTDKLKTFKYSGDNVIFLICLLTGKGYFFNQIFGFRRTHPGGAWTSKSQIDKIKMGYEQLIGLHRFPEFRKAVRSELFYTYLDLLGEDNNSKNNIIYSLKLIRKPDELIYFIKRVLNVIFKTKTKNNFC
ncbi:glycosyltransferase [Kaistella sp. 97-N-M2]|uniref:glycosyltransferase family 2 protein n=1 Tax=Kaistella sp. 97-N-M2 TaxID=2908645 RepID=UPI001F3F3FA4|nr:glycosyltransferase family 2 protein [Kaistella sp. 97-N-M2]UJF28769.1 glycosyltransferase [Kaistella sp. 97-N-M2]